MTKKLLAISNETGERIEFGIENLVAKNHVWLNQKPYVFRLESYTLYYLHQGIYYNYENGKEMV